jgi:hypothetical protein
METSGGGDDLELKLHCFACGPAIVPDGRGAIGIRDGQGHWECGIGRRI